jgi:hypothetical protein
MTLSQYEIRKVLKTLIRKKGNRPSLSDYPPALRGPPNNRYGGHNRRHLCGFRGSTYGPAGPVKRFTREEIQEYERSIKAGVK